MPDAGLRGSTILKVSSRKEVQAVQFAEKFLN